MPRVAQRSLSLACAFLASAVIAARPARADDPPAALNPVERGLRMQAVAQRLIVFDDPYATGDIDVRKPMRGIYGARSIRGAEFYRAINRPDLAESYRRRQVLRYTLIGVGIAVAGLSLFTQVGGALWATTPDRDIGGISVASGALVFAGTGLLVAGAVTPRHPISGDEAYNLAIDYNESLGRGLGSAPRQRRFVFVPAVGRDGAGLALSGRF